MRENKYIGRGIYSIREVCELSGISYPRVRHWIRGDLRTKRKPTPPLIKPDYGKVDGVYYLSFLDMIELRAIHSLIVEAGVSIHLVRKVYSYTREVYNTDHPFATLDRFWTDGKGLWGELPKGKNASSLINLYSGQIELPQVTKMFLNLVDFSEDEHTALRWWPMDRDHHIVVDPQRSFGQPIVDKEGVLTLVLANTYKAERSFKRVAWWYEVSEDAVRSAWEYETSKTKRVAA